MSKYIFLDIDGVLNSLEGLDNYETLSLKGEIILADQGWIEKPLLRRLHDLVYKSNAHIVGVSSWFILPEYINEISKALMLPILDITSDVSGSSQRGMAVLKWLTEHNYNSEKDRFVILDNDTPELNMYYYPTVQIFGSCGLSENNIKESLVFLEKEQSLSEYMEMQKKGMNQIFST